MIRSFSVLSRTQITIRAIAGGVVALAALVGLLHMMAPGAEAQRDTTPLTATSFDLKLVDQLMITDENISISEVIPLGENNVYLLESSKRIDVYRVNVNGTAVRNVRLGIINLEDPIREIIVLDDKASFLIRTRKGIAVYSVTKEEYLVQNR